MVFKVFKVKWFIFKVFKVRQTPCLSMLGVIYFCSREKSRWCFLPAILFLQLRDENHLDIPVSKTKTNKQKVEYQTRERRERHSISIEVEFISPKFFVPWMLRIVMNPLHAKIELSRHGKFDLSSTLSSSNLSSKSVIKSWHGNHILCHPCTPSHAGQIYLRGTFFIFTQMTNEKDFIKTKFC